MLGEAPNASQQQAANARAAQARKEQQQRNAAPSADEFTLGMEDARTGREVDQNQQELLASQVQREKDDGGLKMSRADDSALPPIQSNSGRSVALPVGRRLSTEAIASEVENRIGQFAHQPRVVIRDRAEGVLPGATDADGVAGAVHQGVIFLFRDQLATRAEVRATLFHELLHYGLRRIFSRAQFIREMRGLYERDAWIKDRADAWAQSDDGRRAARFGGEEYAMARGVDEALARLAEPNAGQYTKGLSRAIASVTTWLADMAQSMGFTDVAAKLRGVRNQEARALLQRVFSTLENEVDPHHEGWWEDAEPAFAKNGAGERNLVVLHNLTPDNLLHADKIGGLAVPSLGITKVDAPFGGYGNITLIAPRDMVDPKTGVPVFDRDAYTSRFPEMNYKRPKRAKADALYERMQVLRSLGDDGDQFQSMLWDTLVMGMKMYGNTSFALSPMRYFPMGAWA
ncbi:MAG: hypothetical protein JSR53_06550 [Proteobacteria bacterium]|nr:hypothetical protein [Pseudomonadota bacterium]